MSKYDYVVDPRMDWLGVVETRKAFRDIDARLSALEAANKKDLTAHLYPNGLGVPVNVDPFRIPSTNAPPPPDTHKFAPTPEQREPGWYLFWYDGNPYPWEWCGRRWRSLTGALVSKHEGEEFAQRIQPPKGAA